MQMTDEEVGGIVMLVWYAIVSIGVAICLRKGRQPMWKGFVPVLNAVELCRVAGVSGWTVLTVFVPILNLFAPLYVGMKLGQRFGCHDVVGIALWLSGFTLLPLLGLSRWQFKEDLNGKSVSTDSEPESHAVDTPFAPAVGERHVIDPAHRDSRIRMIVLTLCYGFGLLCIPGLMIVGTMAFGGATADQVKQAEMVVALFALTPISLLIALIGGWILHGKRNYTAASSLATLPILNLVAVFVSFVWIMDK